MQPTESPRHFDTFMSLSTAEPFNSLSDPTDKYFVNTVPTSSKMQLLHILFLTCWGSSGKNLKRGDFSRLHQPQ